jgi:hypothetical protein
MSGGGARPAPAFADRHNAGRKRSPQLAASTSADPVVLGLARDGVAFEVVQALRAPLDLVMARKAGAPEMEEFGIGVPDVHASNCANGAAFRDGPCRPITRRHADAPIPGPFSSDYAVPSASS